MNLSTCDVRPVALSGGGNCTRDQNSSTPETGKTCGDCPLGLSDLCRDDAGIGEIFANWHRITPSVRETIVALAKEVKA